MNCLSSRTLNDQLAAVQSQIPIKKQRVETERDQELIRRLSDPEAIPVQVHKPEETKNQSSPYLRLASSSVGLTPLLKKPMVPDGNRPLRDNLQKLSIFQPGRVTKTAKVDLPPPIIAKENDAGTPSTKDIPESRSEVINKNRFNIDARLKSGAIKRPRPGSHLSK